ncbi:GNAT family protein [Actinocorallia longicatena]|uniref:GNAT family N-acetyltransferase n=1 Tax=Actinocorallia longicatena TaxID=111803 RepID=A0ABP6PW87_9ACTN
MEPEKIEHTEITAGLFHLRPPRLTEAEDLLELASDRDVTVFTPRLKTVTDLESARAMCEKFADWTGRATFSILDAPTERYMGHIMIFGIDREDSVAEVGYRIAPWARGRGVASTCLRAITGWSFATLDLHRIHLLHALDNPASCRVALKNGYLHEGTLRSAFVAGDGLRRDEHLHARLITD